MFLDYYQLREQPFGVTPDPRFLYLGLGYREALASLFYEACPDLKLTEGLREFLAALERAGVKMAVATSASRDRATKVLEHFNLHNHFSAMVTGEDVARGKPDAEIYRSACLQIERDASTALVIEDAVSGVIGARAAGMRCLGIADAQRSPLLYRAGADHVVPDFKGLAVATVQDLFRGDQSGPRHNIF